jgi:hypothetical protein
MGCYDYAMKNQLQGARCLGFSLLALLAMTGCTEDTTVVQADVAADAQGPQDLIGTELIGSDTYSTNFETTDVTEGTATDADGETDIQQTQTDIAIATDADAGTDTVRHQRSAAFFV